MRRAFPSADDVAHAIVAASRLLNVDPEVAIGVKTTLHSQLAAARARCYAAMALDHVFNADHPPNTKHARHSVPRASIGRMVGAAAANAQTIIQATHAKLAQRHPHISWWRTDVFDEVVAAVHRSLDHAPPATESVVISETPPARRRDVVTSLAPRISPPNPKPVKAPSATSPPHITTIRQSITEIVERSGVRTDPANWLIHRGDKSAVLKDPDAFLVVTQLLRVMPALLPADRIASKVWGVTNDAAYRVGKAMDRANVDLAKIGLKIRAMPKIGFALSEA